MLKKAVMVLGVVLTLVGILGFFNDPVLGTFNTNALHNIVHLLSGLVLVFAASRGEDASRTAAKTLGIVYALVTILGFVAPSFVKSLLDVNGADNYLHLLLALVFLYLGYGSKKTQATM